MEGTITRTRVLAWGLWTLALLLSFVTVGVSAAGAYDLAGTLRVVLGVSIPFATVGALIASRKPANPIGWLYCTIGLLEGLSVFASQYANYALLTTAGRLPGGAFMTYLADVTWFPALALMTTFVLLLFPTGHPPTARWRGVGWLAGGGLAVAMIAWVFGTWPVRGVGLLQGNVEDPPGMILAIIIVGMAAVAVSAVASVASLLVRFRRSQGVEREQLKWLAYAGTIAVAGVAAAFLPWPIGETPMMLALLSVPVATAIAILRHHLFDINLLINRTLVYVTLTVFVAGIYVAMVTLVGGFLERQVELGVSLLATGVVAVLFQPLREWVQERVDRLMFGERRSPLVLISRLSQRLEERGDPDGVLSAVAETLGGSLRLPWVSIELLRDGRLVAAGLWGEPDGESHEVPLVYRGTGVGRLLLGLRAPGEAFSAGEHQLVSELARQVSVVAQAVTLTFDLRRSRERLITAREEERRRLRRDLHDGLGPTLAGVALGLEATANLLDQDPAEARRLVDRLSEETQRAISDIRSLVYELRPPSLDELGLVGAIGEQGSHLQGQGRDGGGLLITVEGPESLSSLPAAVEVAAYRIALEALTNVCRHAQARTCRVQIRLDGGLGLEILDDGEGISPDAPAGVGLTSMRERVSELGGVLSITRRTEGGTRVEALLPLEAP
jgi:signal transduction histidine kinase